MPHETGVATLHTIGFTKKSAEQFFGTLMAAGIRQVVDIRLHNQSQLAGFTKSNDLKYFLERICSCGYVHLPSWAPTQEIMDGFKSKMLPWDDYVRQFRALMAERAIENEAGLVMETASCLLCSEASPKQCHRRLVAEYLAEKFPGLEIVHL